MSLPALSQTYYSDMNYALATTSNTAYARSTLFAWKAALKKEILTANSGSITGWTCIGSSDSATAGMDNVDRWGSTFDSTKIVNAASGAHSWIVLYNSTLGIWLTIDYLTATVSNVSVWLAKAAPTGGSTSLRPTSATEVQALSNIQFCDSSGVAAGYVHRVATASGHMMIFSGKAGVRLITNVFGVWPLDTVKTSDNDAWTTVFDYASTGALRTGNTTAGQWRSTTPGFRTRNKANSAFLSLVPNTWQSIAGTQFFGTALAKPDDVEGKHMHATIYMLSLATPTVKGRLADCHQTTCYLDGSAANALLTTPTHMSIGNVLIPFSGIPRL